MSKSIKIIIAIVIALAIAGGAYAFVSMSNTSQNSDKSAVSNDTTEADTNDSTPADTKSTKKTKSLTVNGAITKLKDCGFNVGDKQEIDYRAIGAINGGKVDVDGVTVEVYEFKTAEEAQAERSKVWKEGGNPDTTHFTIGEGFVAVHSLSADEVVTCLTGY